MKRIIFLDIDGVLNNTRWLEDGKPRVWLCPDNIACLHRLTEEAKVHGVVLSSTWRFEGDIQTVVKKRFDPAGIKANWLGSTPDLSRPASKGSVITIGTERGHEIQHWLDEQSEDFNFVILDDDDDMAHLKGRLIQTNPKLGLIDEDVDRAVRLFETQTAES